MSEIKCQFWTSHQPNFGKVCGEPAAYRLVLEGVHEEDHLDDVLFACASHAAEGVENADYGVFSIQNVVAAIRLPHRTGTNA
jgi:hypothetical protein